MGFKPDAVGDLPAFTITFTPGATDPAAVAGGVQVIVRKPNGTETDDSAGVAASGTNVFVYTATTRIDQSGAWRWRINSNSGLIDSFEVGITIPRSAFVDPLP